MLTLRECVYRNVPCMHVRKLAYVCECVAVDGGVEWDLNFNRFTFMRGQIFFAV